MGKLKHYLDALIIGGLLVIFAGIVVHAPLTVWLGTVYPGQALEIKAWKEVLLAIVSVLFVISLSIGRQWHVLKSPLVYTAAGFAALNVALVPILYTGFDATVAGLLINLRFVVFFVLVFGTVRLYPKLQPWFVRVFFVGAAVVAGFALLQLTILPKDALSAIGYSKDTISPYLTVDENPSYVRINSTLRGPNPLGAYTVIVLAALLAVWLRGPKKLSKLWLWGAMAVAFGSVAALWASYSRSAVLAAVVSIALVVWVAYGKRMSKLAWAVIAVVVLVLGGSLIAFKDTQFVSQVILHEDPYDANTVNSNDGHAASLEDGFRRVLENPLGAGIGSTGSASLHGDSPLIIENQYLFVAHESGWLGLGLFALLYGAVLWAAWRARRSWLALGVFASGVGLAVAGLFLPVFTDDTVALVWWGLAAVSLGIVGAQEAPVQYKAKRRAGAAVKG